MNIYDMIPGKTYLAGDSLGYDVVICIAQHPPNYNKKFPIDFPTVEVQYEDGRRDFWFESPGLQGIYVEPRQRV